MNELSELVYLEALSGASSGRSGTRRLRHVHADSCLRKPVSRRERYYACIII